MTKPQFKITKRVTLPVLQLKPGAGDRFLKIMSPMRLGEKLDDQKGAATLFEAIDLVTGEYGNVIPPTIMQKELNKNYPGESYVGKCFSVTVTRDTARKYNHVFLAEVEEPAEAPEVEEPAEVPEGGDVSESGTVAGGDEAADVSTAATPIQSAGGKRRR